MSDLVFMKIGGGYHEHIIESGEISLESLIHIYTIEYGDRKQLNSYSSVNDFIDL